METNETSYGSSHNFENWPPNTQDVPQARMDSFDKVLEEYRTGDFNGRADSGIMIAEIMAALAPGRHIATESQQDEVMDSMESVPSSVINSALKGYDKTSLPEVHDNEITQALMPGQRPPYLLNQAILVSPPSYDESYAQATYHDLQTRPFLDPNQEIHGVQPGFYSNALPVPEPEHSEPQRFQPATTANQPDSQNLHPDDDVMSVKSTDSSTDTSYKLSPETNLEITVSYSTLPVCGTVKVERAEGCIMFYNKTSKELLDRCQAVSFPSLENTEVKKKFEKVSPRAMELTERALNALQGGLQLYWKPQKGVFAIRRSRGKIYWTSTQLASPEPQELARNVETQVFDWDIFRSSLSKTYALKATKQDFQEPKLPSIIFTFAQKWCKDTAPVTSCLVWAKVIPKKADEMVVGLFPKAEPAAHSKHNSGMLRVSLE
ncbi:hypothetical protein BSL78_12606 [Apostichopus japonicus]|uniref:Interferon regulatory factor-3 domain-containing protein n=1 Tax=Stichopus japonicus TaxID=307972 RepID=A0A2G8KR59_STIJA|nr:hypothetical protein BSL78_12606 [Apostichopus japonicus]